MATITRANLEDLASSSCCSITDVNHVSSYNWIEADKPTIAVPGCPPLWKPLKTDRQLAKDSGLVYIAQNAARHPDSPLEPLFRSVFLTNPAYDVTSVDVITDRNNMRKLLYFVNPKLNKFEQEPFTIKAEVVGKTTILSRDEAVTQETIGPNDFRGFGHNFEKAYTSTEISGSTGHHRVISYQFSGLKFIVRHETDGYINTPSAPINRGDKAEDSAGLARMMDTLSVSSPTNPIDRPDSIAGSKLSMRQIGKRVPLESTLEIKTRAIKRPLGIVEVAPQLWVSQTPKLVRAYHSRGTFYKPQVEDVATQIKAWESAHQDDLKRLGGLMQKIVSTVEKAGGAAVIKYDVSRDELKICNAVNTPLLPKDLYSRWDVKEGKDEDLVNTVTSCDGKPNSAAIDSKQKNRVVGISSQVLPRLD